MGRLMRSRPFQWLLTFAGRRAALFLNALGFVVIPGEDVQTALKALAGGANAVNSAEGPRWKAAGARQAMARAVTAIMTGLKNTRVVLRYDD